MQRTATHHAIGNPHLADSPARSVRRSLLCQLSFRCSSTCEAMGGEADRQLDVAYINICPDYPGSSCDVRCLVFNPEHDHTCNNPGGAFDDVNHGISTSHRSQVHFLNQSGLIDASPSQLWNDTSETHARPLPFHQQPHNSDVSSSYPSEYQTSDKPLTDAFPSPSCRSLTNHISSLSLTEVVTLEYTSGTISRQKSSRGGDHHCSPANQSRSSLKTRRRFVCSQML